MVSVWCLDGKLPGDHMSKDTIYITPYINNVMWGWCSQWSLLCLQSLNFLIPVSDCFSSWVYVQHQEPHSGEIKDHKIIELKNFWCSIFSIYVLGRSLSLIAILLLWQQLASGKLPTIPFPLFVSNIRVFFPPNEIFIFSRLGCSFLSTGWLSASKAAVHVN